VHGWKNKDQKETCKLLQDRPIRGLFLQQWDKLDAIRDAENLLLLLEVLEDLPKVVS
jgi:hypothetical protein